MRKLCLRKTLSWDIALCNEISPRVAVVFVPLIAKPHSEDTLRQKNWMTIHERLSLTGRPLDTDAALRLWLGTIRALLRSLPAGDVHTRLGANSFVFEHGDGHEESEGGGAETDRTPNAEVVPRLRELASHIGEASSRIEDVIRGIKEYGRGGREAARERQAPEEIASRAVRFSHILASQYTENFHYVPPEQPFPEIEVIPGLLEQALINLIKNACEALTDRSQAVELRTAFRTEAGDGADTSTGEIVFSVCDQGRGVPETVTEEGPKPFLSDRASSGGTGLGLSIVRTIIEQHHGTLELVDDDRFATVFELRVPVVSA
ncbi:MAG: sensor histidine kinase [Spirochaetaceae bacterium]|nr:MAG: sensor histidine kinase [Spirochaetaceae bacterium]